MKVYTIAITGRFGSGKTMIANILQEKGSFLLIADEIAHDLYKNGTHCWSEIVQYFGKSILTKSGEIERNRLGKIVFSDEKKLAKLKPINPATPVISMFIFLKYFLNTCK